MLEKIEAELAQVTGELEKVEQAVTAATLRRPTAELVQASRQNVLETWEDATNEERAMLLAGVVERVEISKNKAAMRLSPIASPHG